jgi:hypothetical protein
MNLQYYLIHGIDKQRGPRMIEEFNKWGLDNNKVKWILEPNKDKIDNVFRNSVLIKNESYSCGNYTYPGCPNIKNGQISCSFKHYLCLRDIIENNYDYGVVMEDNTYFIENIPELVNKYIYQLTSNYNEWDILFDCNWTNYIEGPTKPELLVYPKNNEITAQCHGGSKAASFYLITNECAKKLYEHYIPFNNSPDWWMNDLFRKLNIKSFWVEPSKSLVREHVSTVDLS